MKKDIVSIEAWKVIKDDFLKIIEKNKHEENLYAALGVEGNSPEIDVVLSAVKMSSKSETFAHLIKYSDSLEEFIFSMYVTHEVSKSIQNSPFHLLLEMLHKQKEK
jgi:hypothetical protein